MSMPMKVLHAAGTQEASSGPLSKAAKTKSFETSKATLRILDPDE
jgi:hypothetical protein